MRLREKIGQLFVLGFEGCELSEDSAIAEAIVKHNLGGVILFDLDYQSQEWGKNIASFEQVKTLNYDLQALSAKAHRQAQRDNLPLFISVDYEGGRVNRLKEDYGFVKTCSAKEFAGLSIKARHAMLLEMARCMAEAGFNVDFAPVLDLALNPDNPVISQLDRSYAANEDCVIECATQFIEAFSAQGIVCVAKHFPGHGNSCEDSHRGFVDVTSSWQACELKPYQALTKKPHPLLAIMPGHLINHRLDECGLPASLSHQMLNILRQEMNFDGLIVSDDMQMGAISSHFELRDCLKLAINAGVDCLVFGNQLLKTMQGMEELVDIVCELVARGEIATDRIERAYARIVATKQMMQRLS